MTSHPLILRGAFALGLLLGCSAAAEDTRIAYFEDSVLPLLQKRCYKCHSHETKIKGGLVLDSRSGWETGGDSGAAAVAGEPDSSLLLKAVAYVDDDLRMPPKSRLSDEEVAVLRKWIEDGAVDPRETTQPAEESGENVAKDLWSLKPLQVDEFQRHSIDGFLHKQLVEAGLEPNETADRAALLRRASFGLTGLPPTPEQVEDFLTDDGSDAWERLIDRLLDSPRYGERWGRHWLDLARYGDSNGGDINYAHANAWRYRDYVIQSFNTDKPYDDFIREQLAGDLLAKANPERRAELMTATGFLMLGPKMLAEVDGEKLLIDIVDEQLDVAGKTFLGMTFGCARCHDHKFDPITAKDYYAMAGIFRSTKVMDSLRPQKIVGEWVEIDVTPPEERQLIDSLTVKKEQLQSELSAFGEEANTNEGPAAAAHRAVVAKNLPELRSTTWAARVRIDTPQSLGTAISAAYKGASQGHSLGFDRIKNGRAPRVVWNHYQQSTIITAAEPITLGNWHHLGVTYDRETKRLVLYVDGEPSASAEGVESTPFSTIGVGRREAPKEFQLLGDVDDVVVYDIALTPEEMVILDAGQKLAHQPVLHWDFETIEGDEVVDAAGKHNGRFVGLTAESGIIEDGFNQNALTLKRISRALTEADQERLNELRARLKVVDDQMSKPIIVMAVQADEPVDLPIHIRGSHTNPSKETVPRTTPAVFESSLPAIEVAAQSNGRLELADWITHPDNPLTARVMVNRIWRQHFGEGLVRSPSNFGRRGELPSHHELLDWLAYEFMNSGWSIKHMHRLIMTSDAYRRSSDLKPAVAEADADNRLLARYPIRRLEAEAIRDALLAVSGGLQFGSPGNLMMSPNMKRVAMTPDDPVYKSHHRGVYLPTIRVRGYEMFSIFDISSNGRHVAVRPQTMVAQQALFFLNNPFVTERAGQVAARILTRDETDAAKIDWLHRLMFGRSASKAETGLLQTHLQHLRMNQSEEATWEAIAHSLFCSNEFIHLR